MFPFLKEAAKNLFSKPSTVEYPFKVKESPAKPNYRGRISYDPEKCVNCGSCLRVCCPEAITVVKTEVPGGHNITYSFDLTSCTFCGTCQDFCDEGAIRMTCDYHMVAEDPEDLIVRGTKYKEDDGKVLACSEDCIFCTLCAVNCPREAIKVDRNTKKWEVDYDICEKCGLCFSKCPKQALSFQDKATAEDMRAKADAKHALEAEKLAAAKLARKEAENADAHAPSHSAEQRLVVSQDCIHCTLCARNCPQDAITVDRAKKHWSYDPEKCIQCELCLSKCPKNALSFVDAEEAERLQMQGSVLETAQETAPAPESAKEAAPAVGCADDAERKLECSDECIFCTLCARNCPQDAITVDRANKQWSYDPEKCIQCELCVSKCPKKALEFK